VLVPRASAAHPGAMGAHAITAHKGQGTPVYARVLRSRCRSPRRDRLSAIEQRIQSMARSDMPAAKRTGTCEDPSAPRPARRATSAALDAVKATVMKIASPLPTRVTRPSPVQIRIDRFGFLLRAKRIDHPSSAYFALMRCAAPSSASLGFCRPWVMFSSAEAIADQNRPISGLPGMIRPVLILCIVAAISGSEARVL
jgi:hypothetical protein